MLCPVTAQLQRSLRFMNSPTSIVSNANRNACGILLYLSPMKNALLSMSFIDPYLDLDLQDPVADGWPGPPFQILFIELGLHNTNFFLHGQLWRKL